MKKELVFQVDNASFSYSNSREAVENISFEVFEGDFIAILGANGAGKSTLLKMLGGLLFPQKGKIFFHEKELTEKNFKDSDFKFFFRKEVAFLFQNSDVQLFCSTVEDELAFTVVQLGFEKNEIQKRVLQCAEMFNLNHLLQFSPQKLSEGEKKRVAFASLLPQNPSVFLLDEPTANLDPKNEKLAKSFLKNLSDSKKTIICAAHDIDFAKCFASKTAIISQNHNLAKFGKTSEILNDEKLLIENDII